LQARRWSSAVGRALAAAVLGAIGVLLPTLASRAWASPLTGTSAVGLTVSTVATTVDMTMSVSQDVSAGTTTPTVVVTLRRGTLVTVFRLSNGQLLADQGAPRRTCPSAVLAEGAGRQRLSCAASQSDAGPGVLIELSGQSPPGTAKGRSTAARTSIIWVALPS
jgi:hypothetical protein